MKIINTTRNVILADNVVVASTIFKRLKGLLGRKELGKSEALVIRPCNSIHSFFMRFPIAALFVDKNNKAIAALDSFPPSRISKIYFGAAYVIELPAGSLKPTGTIPGDLIEIEIK